MNPTLEQMRESLIQDLKRYKDPTQLNGTDYYVLPINKLEHLITEVWNEAIKECEVKGWQYIVDATRAESWSREDYKKALPKPNTTSDK